MGNREERAGLAMWKRFQKTAEMTFWGDKPNGSGLKRRRRRSAEPGLSYPPREGEEHSFIS